MSFYPHKRKSNSVLQLVIIFLVTIDVKKKKKINN